MSISCETETRNLTEQNILIALNNTLEESFRTHSQTPCVSRHLCAEKAFLEREGRVGPTLCTRPRQQWLSAIIRSVMISHALLFTTTDTKAR